uniref:Uncharacterized protein n=1 Tax=Meloidogyne enterolobii TaxID=390850 RepID=A0A6V7WZ16_MELEN|nr:unnamed protein product [Meloidogyne enterolobii]
MDNNRMSVGTSGSLTNIGTLSPVVMFDWIRNEIQELQSDQLTLIFAQALERQSDRVLQLMRHAFDNREDDVYVIMLKYVGNFTRNKNQKYQDMDDFVLISHYLWKLLCKVLNWRVKRNQNTRPLDDAKKDEQLRINKDNPYNSAILKTSKRSVVNLGTYSDRPMEDLFEEEVEDEDEESLIKIPSRRRVKAVNNRGLKNEAKLVNDEAKVESSSRQITMRQNSCSNENQSNNQMILRRNVTPGEGQRNQIHDVSSDTTQNEETANLDYVEASDDDDRYLRASLREESLDDFFSNDKDPEKPDEAYVVKEVEDTNMQDLNEIATEVKKELMSDTEEESEEVEEETDVQQANMQNSVIIVKQEENYDGFSNNVGMQNAQMSNSVIIYDPTEHQESSSATSSNEPLPDLHQDIPLPPAPINPRLQLSAMSSSSLPVYSKNSSLKWGLRNKSTVSAKAIAPKVTREVCIDQSCSNTDMETGGVSSKRQRLDLVEQPRDLKESFDDDDYSEFCIGPQQAKLPWHMSPILVNNNTDTTEMSDPSSSNNKTGYSSKIKKYRRADYLKEQKARRKEMKQGRNVKFFRDNDKETSLQVTIRNFVIEEGNVFKRYDYVNECKVHVPGSTNFLNRPLGQIPAVDPSNIGHRKLTRKLKAEIKALVSDVLLRGRNVVEQNLADKFVAPADRLCRISRLFVTDSMLAGVKDEVFRNMYIFRLDFHKHMDLFISQLDVLHQYILNQLCAFEFSYVFVLYGYDLVNQEGTPSLDSTIKLKNWFEENLSGYNLQKSKEDCVYQYSIPQFVVVTIPELGSHAEQIRAYNNELRIHVENKQRDCPNGMFGDFILLDWAQLMIENGSNSDELAINVLVRKLIDFGVLFK